MSRTVEVTELVLRDGHQRLLATRVALEDMSPACADLVDTSISSLSLGPGHNPTEAMVEMLEGTG